jgi:tetratricopeptide (TPR) repeat protein
MGVADLKAKAREAFKRKNYEQSVEIYVEAIQFGPDDMELYEGLQQAAEKQRETRGKSLFGGGLGKLSLGAVREPMKKLVACVRYLAKNPGDKGVLMDLGDAAEAAGHLNGAVYGFRAAAKADPDDNRAWKRLGGLLYRQGKIKEAAEAYGEAVRLDPKDQEALKMRKNLAAEGALKMGGYESAKSSRELIRDKDIAGKLERDQRLQLTQQDATDEVARLRADVAKNPAGTVRVRIRLAEVLQQKGEVDEALKEFEEAAKLDPANYDLSVRIGDIHLSRAQEAYVAAKSAAEASGDPAAKAAFEQARADLIDKRLKEYSRRVKDHPTDLGERYRLGDALLRAGRVDEAIGEFQKTVQDPRRKTDSLLRLGECFEKKQMLDLAAKQVQKAAEDFPQLNSERAKEVTYRLGELHERRGAKDDAKREFMKIYEVDIAYRDVAQRVASLGG